jgi:hypothetical protein
VEGFRARQPRVILHTTVYPPAWPCSATPSALFERIVLSFSGGEIFSPMSDGLLNNYRLAPVGSCERIY